MKQVLIIVFMCSTTYAYTQELYVPNGPDGVSASNNDKVGIGTAYPVSTLDVNGDLAFKYGGVLRVNVPDGEYANWTTNSNRIILKTGWSSVFGDYLDFRVPGAGLNNAIMRFTKQGRLGIGVNEPIASLDVLGGINVRGNLYSDGAIQFNRTSEIAIKPFTGGNNTPSRTHTIIKNGWRHNQDYTSIHAAGITSNEEASIVIQGSGNVGIGTTNPQSRLAVEGQIRAKEVKVLTDIAVPDYVFENDYELPTIAETQEYIEQNKHLPGIPSASEISEHGLDLADMNLRLLKKIEELTLYLIEKEHQYHDIKKELASLQQELQVIKAKQE